MPSDPDVSPFGHPLFLQVVIVQSDAHKAAARETAVRLPFMGEGAGRRLNQLCFMRQYPFRLRLARCTSPEIRIATPIMIGIIQS